MNYNSNKNNNSESDVISWIITGLCLWLCWPLGLVFLISKLGKNDFLKRSITKALDKAAYKKNNYYGSGFKSQWGDVPKWGNAPNQNAAPNQKAEANQYNTEQSPQGPYQNTTAAPHAPMWGQAPNWADPSKVVNDAFKKANDFRMQKEAEIRREAERRREEQRHRDVERRAEASANRDPGREADRAQRKDKRSSQKYAPAADADRVSKGRGALMVFGWILFALGIFQVFEPVYVFELWQIIQWGAVAAGGGAMLIAAARKSKKEKEYEKYVKIVGGKACVEIDKIAMSMGSKQKEVYKELEDMVQRGYFGKAAYIDMASGMLIVDPEAAEAEFKAKAPPPPPEAETPKDKYDLLLSELSHACMRIESPVMKEKADKIESLTEQIFAYVRETPEKESSISSFINYYLPTTLKLITSYADFESQEFQGQNIVKSRERIEAAADTIIEAYERQLDNLFLIDTIDVTSDISVLENMMKRDGLSGKNDFGSSMPSN